MKVSWDWGLQSLQLGWHVTMLCGFPLPGGCFSQPLLSPWYNPPCSLSGAKLHPSLGFADPNLGGHVLPALPQAVPQRSVTGCSCQTEVPGPPAPSFWWLVHLIMCLRVHVRAPAGSAQGTHGKAGSSTVLLYFTFFTAWKTFGRCWREPG